MEKALQKLAGQLNAYDEASLLELWDKYAQVVARFEPSKRWEEAVLIFGMIQAMHWKNQLFNYNLAQGAASLQRPERNRTQPEDKTTPDLLARLTELGEALEGDPAKQSLNIDKSKSGSRHKRQERCKILPFRPRKPRKS